MAVALGRRHELPMGTGQGRLFPRSPGRNSLLRDLALAVALGGNAQPYQRRTCER